MTRRFRLGLIVNPLAGMGGRVGLKGTDGRADEALKLGAKPSSGERAQRALKRLAASHPSLTIVAAHGAMGQDAASETGFLGRIDRAAPGSITTAADTDRRGARDGRARRRSDTVLRRRWHGP